MEEATVMLLPPLTGKGGGGDPQPTHLISIGKITATAV